MLRINTPVVLSVLLVGSVPEVHALRGLGPAGGDGAVEPEGSERIRPHAQVRDVHRCQGRGSLAAEVRAMGR